MLAGRKPATLELMAGGMADNDQLLAEPSAADEERLFEEAFKDPEVASAIQAELMGRAELDGALRERLPGIRDASAPHRAQIADAITKLRRLRDGRPPPRGAVTRALRVLFIGLLVALGIAVITAVVVGFAHGWRTLVGDHVIAWVVGLTPFVAPIVATVAIMQWMLGRRFAKQQREWRAGREQPLAKAQDDVRNARGAWQDQFLRLGLVPELRELIGVLSQPDYRVVLPRLKAVGLGEVFVPDFEIRTEAKDRITRLLQTMRGGSIGISGPRGAGKSTLVRYFCGGGFATLRERDVLPLLVTAPVGYETRDFILHLFSSFCRRILEKKGVADQDTPRTVPRPLESFARRFTSILAGACAGAGSLMVGVALFLAWARSSTPQPKEGTAPSFGSALLGDSAPTGFLVWGAVLLVGAAFYFMWTTTQRERSGETREEEIAAKVTDEKLRKLEANDSLVRQAVRWLARIRFQQSYSSGWSGALSLPLSTSVGINGAESFAQNQLSLPEIVNSFRELVTAATREYAVIIGIDELDKLETDEKAFQFLNDIKAVFGIDHAFYLLSVSENAMSNFERRGLPIRDAFDSAFDAIVHVEFLGVEETSRLLKRRVVGLPLPFHHLCHGLSGGLPRDHIRVARDVVYLGERLGNSPPIGAIANDLIRTELRAKATAVSIAARRLPLAEPVSTFQTRLRDLEHAEDITLVGLQLHVQALTSFADALATRHGIEEDLRGARDSLVSLAYELAAFTLCLAITGAVFTAPDPHTLAQQATRLAELRQALGVYPRFAYELARQHPLFLSLTAPRPVPSAR